MIENGESQVSVAHEESGGVCSMFIALRDANDRVEGNML